MPNQDITTGEIMEFLKEHAVVKEDLNGLATKEDLNGLATNLRETKEELQREMGKMKQDLLDGMDDKLSNLRGDLVVLMRKEDVKLRELVNMLHAKNILTDPEVKRILTMEPFSQLMV